MTGYLKSTRDFSSEIKDDYPLIEEIQKPPMDLQEYRQKNSRSPSGIKRMKSKHHNRDTFNHRYPLDEDMTRLHSDDTNMKHHLDNQKITNQMVPVYSSVHGKHITGAERTRKLVSEERYVELEQPLSASIRKDFVETRYFDHSSDKTNQRNRNSKNNNDEYTDRKSNHGRSNHKGHKSKSRNRNGKKSYKHRNQRKFSEQHHQ